jgi:hypothetical protein
LIRPIAIENSEICKRWGIRDDSISRESCRVLLIRLELPKDESIAIVLNRKEECDGGNFPGVSARVLIPRVRNSQNEFNMGT